MKKTFTIFAVIFFSGIFCDSYSQTYNGVFQELYFGRQPSARAEAMGKGLASVTGDANSYFYNPAGPASLKGLNLNASFSNPYYVLNNAYYDFFGASYNINKYGTAGFSVDYFDYGINVNVTDEFGNVTGTFTPKITNYRLNLASEVIPDLFVGLNLNLLNPDLNSGFSLSVGNEKGSEGNIFYFDLGVIKSFNFSSKSLDQKINLGTSLINVNTASYSFSDASQGDQLPVIFRIGAAYDLSLNDRTIVSKLKSYNFLINIEYEDLFNSAVYGGVHTGLEFTFLEILSLRGGFYTQKINDHGFNSINENSLSEFTYGLGLNVPIKQLTNGETPVEFKFDFASMQQPSYIKIKTDWDNFFVYSFILNWIF